MTWTAITLHSAGVTRGRGPFAQTGDSPVLALRKPNEVVGPVLLDPQTAGPGRQR
jgi:hypothetical protein